MTPKPDSAKQPPADAHAGHVMPKPAPAADPHAGHQMAGSQPDSAGALAAVEQFHAAIAAGDSLRALSLLADDVTIQEGGAVDSKVSYRSGHLGADIAFTTAIPAVRSDVRVRLAGHVAWVTAATSTTGTYNGRPVNSAGAELMVLLHGADGWRITNIHWSSRRRSSP
jgi:ketosteroid isomerase-like protein